MIPNTTGITIAAISCSGKERSSKGGSSFMEGRAYRPSCAAGRAGCFAYRRSTAISKRRPSMSADAPASPS